MEDEEPLIFPLKNTSKKDITDIGSKSTAGSGGSGKSTKQQQDVSPPKEGVRDELNKMKTYYTCL